MFFIIQLMTGGVSYVGRDGQPTLDKQNAMAFSTKEDAEAYASKNVKQQYTVVPLD